MAWFTTFLHPLPSLVSSHKKSVSWGWNCEGTSYYCLPDISYYNLPHSPKRFVSDCQHCTISFMTVEEIWHLAELCIGYLGVTVQWIVIINIIIIFWSCCGNVKSHSASQFLSSGKRGPGRPLTHASSPQFHRRSRLVSHPRASAPTRFRSCHRCTMGAPSNFILPTLLWSRENRITPMLYMGT